MAGIFKVYIVEVRDRRAPQQQFCPTGDHWYHKRAYALDQMALWRALHSDKVYRVRRYLAADRSS